MSINQHEQDSKYQQAYKWHKCTEEEPAQGSNWNSGNQINYIDYPQTNAVMHNTRPMKDYDPQWEHRKTGTLWDIQKYKC